MKGESLSQTTKSGKIDRPSTLLFFLDFTQPAMQIGNVFIMLFAGHGTNRLHSFRNSFKL